MTDTYTDSNSPAEILSAGLKRLEELRSFYNQAVSELEAGRASGRDRVAALQAEVDSENAKLVDVVAEAATEFNDESSRLTETGFATPKALSGLGFANIRVPKRG